MGLKLMVVPPHARTVCVKLRGHGQRIRPFWASTPSFDGCIVPDLIGDVTGVPGAV
jgi:hypothetical protein